jgi:hypothetical protein
MFAVQRDTYRATTHLEWPWVHSNNPWQQAFDWIRTNTPTNAVFALDPNYMDEALEDHQGFRAVTQRSTLADRAKDGGVAALFPSISEEWATETKVAAGLTNFVDEPKSTLPQSGANWIVTGSQVRDVDCPYRNAILAVCNLGSGAMVARQHPGGRSH